MYSGEGAVEEAWRRRLDKKILKKAWSQIRSMKRDKDHTVREPEPQRGRSFYVRVGEKWFKISPKEGCSA